MAVVAKPIPWALSVVNNGLSTALSAEQTQNTELVARKFITYHLSLITFDVACVICSSVAKVSLTLKLQNSPVIVYSGMSAFIASISTRSVTI